MSERAIQDLEQHQGQLDEDGICVAVSRQALNETLDYVDSLRKENERLRACLKFAKHALEPYDDVKPRNWLTDKDNLREAHQAILKILTPQIEEKGDE